MSKNLVMVPALATKPSHFYSASTALSSARDDWETPPDLFALLDSEHHFTLDPCSNGRNNLCATHFTRQQNGLARSWRGHRVFMNPPYGRNLRAWMEKARSECRDNGVLVVALVPARVETHWWHDNVFDAFAHVHFIRGRVGFLLNGVASGKAPFPSAIVTYRPGQVR